MRILVNPQQVEDCFKNKRIPVICVSVEGIIKQGSFLFATECQWYKEEPDAEVFLQYLKANFLCPVEHVYDRYF